MGKILAICTSPRRGTVKTAVPSRGVTPEWAIGGRRPTAAIGTARSVC